MKKLIIKILPAFIINYYRDYKRFKAYRGNKVFCPICKKRFRLFAPFGVKTRVNAMCHKCGSLERHRLLYLYFRNKVKFFKMQTRIKLLHFAPEKSLYNIFSSMKNIEYFPCDLKPELYQFNGKSKVAKADITSIPFDSSMFDVIICNHVLEHIPNDKQAMLELYRVMKKKWMGHISSAY